MYEPSENYPFATPQGEPIPLDIIKPKTLYVCNFAADATQLVSINNTTKVAFVYSSVDVILSFGITYEDYEDSLPRENALFLPKKYLMSVAVPDGDVFVTSLGEAGFATIQLIERWAGMNPQSDFTNR